MLRLCSRGFYFLLKNAKESDAALTSLVVKKINRANHCVTCQNRKSYAHISSTLKLRNRALAKFLLLASSKRDISIIANPTAQFDQATDRTRKKNGWMFAVLGGLIGLVYVSHDSVKVTDFIYAAKYGNIQELKRLMQSGVDVNTKHPLGWNALHAAAINGQAKAAQLLIEKGIDIDAGDEFTSIHKVAKEKQLPVLQVLQYREEEFFDRLNSNVNFKGFTALHYAVLIDSVDCVQLLVDAGVNPRIKNDAGYTAIDYAKEGMTQMILKKYIVQYDEMQKARVRTHFASLRIT